MCPGSIACLAVMHEKVAAAISGVLGWAKCACGHLFRNAEKDRQAAFNLQHALGVQMPESLPEFVFFDGHGLVHHHLRRLLQPVLWVGLHGHAQQRRSHQGARHQKNSHARVLAELVGLNDQGRPGFAKIALHGDGDEVAPPHALQPSASASASSMKSSRSSSAMSACAASLD